MKKLVVLAIVLPLILSACATPAGTNAPSPDISELPSIPAVTETTEPSPADGDPWMEPFRAAILDAAEFYSTDWQKDIDLPQTNDLMEKMCISSSLRS